MGKHDSAEAIARYAVLIGMYQAGGLELPDDFDVRRLDERAAVMLGQLAPSAVATHQVDQPILVRHVTEEWKRYVNIKYKTAITTAMAVKTSCRRRSA